MFRPSVLFLPNRPFDVLRYRGSNSRAGSDALSVKKEEAMPALVYSLRFSTFSASRPEHSHSPFAWRSRSFLTNYPTV